MPDYGLLANKWKHDHLIHIQHGRLECGPVASNRHWHSAQWEWRELTSNDNKGSFRIVNRWKSDEHLYLDGSGTLQCGVAPNTWAAMRKCTSDGGGWFFIENQKSPSKKLHIEHGSLTAGEIQNGWLSARWCSRDPSKTHMSFIIGSAGHGSGQPKSKSAGEGGRLDVRLDIADFKTKTPSESWYNYGEYEVGGHIGSAAEILNHMETFFSCCHLHWVVPVIYYTGHGDNVGGNWCFPSGTVKFDDIVKAYDKSGCTQICRILADCCHAGYWVWDAKRVKESSGKKWIVIAAANHDKLATNRVFAEACFKNDKDSQLLLRNTCDAISSCESFEGTHVKCFHGEWHDGRFLECY